MKTKNLVPWAIGGAMIAIVLNFILYILLGGLIGYAILYIGIFVIPLVSSGLLFLLLTPFNLSKNEKFKVVGLSVLISLIIIPLFKFLYMFVQ